MKRLLREPLVHFVLLGAAFFAVSGFLAAGAGKERIVVSAGQVEHLSANFTRTWLRPPTESELDGLIEDYVRDEVAYREALALGLDRDDTVIRRRLRQKMEFISEDAVEAEPSDDDLRDYLARNADAFRTEELVTFHQIYLDAARRGDAVDQDAARLLEELRKRGPAADVSDLGDPTLLEREYEQTALSVIARSLGKEFAAGLAPLPVGEWSGPLRSAYGVHLVYVVERSESALPPFEDIRDAVRREWTNARRKAESEKLYRSLLERYSVTVERPAANPAQWSLSRRER